MTGKPPQRPGGRGDHYYRRVFLNRYIYDQPSRGLGKHRLPRIRLWPDRGPRGQQPAAVRLLLLLSAITIFFICTLLCLIVVQALLKA